MWMDDGAEVELDSVLPALFHFALTAWADEEVRPNSKLLIIAYMIIGSVNCMAYSQHDLGQTCNRPGCPAPVDTPFG